MRVVPGNFVTSRSAAFGRLMVLLACVALPVAPLTAQSGEEAKPAETKKQDEADAKQEKKEGDQPADLESLVKAYGKAGGAKAKREIIAKIFAVDGAAEKLAEMVKADSKLKSVFDAYKMQICVNAFRQLEKKHPGQNLTYAGQFEPLKKYGKLASEGALLLMKDYDLHTEADRAKSWEILADLDDKSVLPELRKIAEDFLYADQVQLGAIYSMAALGDPTGIEKKAQEYRDRAKEEPRSSLSCHMQIAFIYSHGRMYKKAIGVQNDLISYFHKILQEHGAEMPAEQKQAYRLQLANLFYNSACSHSLMKDMKGAYAKLQMALQYAHDNYIKLIPRDGDFRNLRADKDYKKWFELAKAKKLPPLKAPAKSDEKPDAEASGESKAGEAPAGGDEKAGDEKAGGASGEGSGEAAPEREAAKKNTK